MTGAGKAPLRLVQPPSEPEAAPESHTAPQAEPEGPPPDLESVFRRYAPYVAAVGLRILGRQDEIDDLVQDVFLEAHRGLGELRHPGAIKGWLATVTVRLARRRLSKRRVKRWLHLDGTPDYGDVATGEATPEQRTLLAQLYGALDRLPVEQRLAWTLRYVEGERLDRVALLCGCSLATAKRRIAAAQSALQKTLHR